MLEEAGIDLIDVSGGIHETIYMIVPPMDIPLGCHVHLAAAIKEVVDIPVAVVGRINDPIQADTILLENKADFIVLGRALHADPEFPKKAQEGRLDEIRNCLACNEGCIDTLTTRSPITCVVNAAAGKENEFKIKVAEKKKKVIVIGGGPGGMEAARVASLRGHEVILYEKNNELGGQIKIAKNAPNMEGIEDSIRFLSTQMDKLGVTVNLGVEATPEMVESLKPDAVVVATGGVPFKPLIPGIEQPHVYTAWELFEGKAVHGKKAIILGGDLIACEAALYLSKRGVKVIIINPEIEFAINEGTRVLWTLLKPITDDPNISIRNRSTIERINNSSIVTQTDGKFDEIDGVDSVIISAGNISSNKVGDALILGGKIPAVYKIGDCLEPRKQKDAIHEGMAVGLRI
jgi:NADPH-dependent 2,4-dienoyl-CoA reductase/sulfur reductase-like enzyme